jgi:hypothetical protein
LFGITRRADARCRSFATDRACARRVRFTSDRYNSGVLVGHDDSRLLGLISSPLTTNMVQVAGMTRSGLVAIRRAGGPATCKGAKSAALGADSVFRVARHAR